MTADLQARRRHRPDRDPGPRGRPRGRRVQPDRPEAVRRARGRTSRPRAGSRPPTASRCGSPCPTGERLAYATAEPEERYRLASCTARQDARSPNSWSSGTAGEPTLVIGAVPRPARRARRAPGRPGDQGRDHGQGARAAVRRLPHRRDRAAGRLQGRQLLHRPARGRGRDPGLRRVRLPSGGGPAARPAAAAQGRRHRPRASTRSSPATPSTPTSPRTGSASWPSRATPTGSSTPTTWTGWTSSPAARRGLSGPKIGHTSPIRPPRGSEAPPDEVLRPRHRRRPRGAR